MSDDHEMLLSSIAEALPRWNLKLLKHERTREYALKFGTGRGISEICISNGILYIYLWAADTSFDLLTCQDPIAHINNFLGKHMVIQD